MSDIFAPHTPPPDPRSEDEKAEARMRGQILRAIRIALDIGMRDAAKNLGVSLVELCNVERGLPHTVPRSLIGEWFGQVRSTDRIFRGD